MQTKEQTLTGYPSIDKPWLKYYSEEAINASLPECTIYEYLWNNNKDHLDDVAIVYFGREITYGKLFENIEKVASAFIALGVKKSDVVTIQSLSFPQVIYMIYALSKLGAIANLIYATSTSKEVNANLIETQTKIYVTVESVFKKIDIATENKYIQKIILLSVEDEMNMLTKWIYRVKTKSTAVKDNDKILGWKSFVSLGSCEKTNIVGKNMDPVVIIYTGGTTGKSKGVILSNYNLNIGALQYYHLGYEREKIFLSVLPPFIAFGITVTMHMPLAFGLKMVLGVCANPSDVSGFVEKYKPNYIICGTVQADKIVDALDEKKVDLSALICLGVGGDTLSPKLEEKINNFLRNHNSSIKVVQGYAMSETSAAAVGSTYTKSTIVYKKGTVGVPFVYTNIKIVDVETNEELPYYERGEICINTPCTMQEYLKNKEETDNILRRHKDNEVWVHTGDVGYIDEDGFITIVGRIKRIILTCENDVYHKVFPKLIEDELLKIRCIKSVSIVGDSKCETNNRIAFVVLEKGVSEVDALDILKSYAHDNLESYERPARYVFKDKLPLTTIGKIDYRALEKEIEG